MIRKKSFLHPDGCKTREINFLLYYYHYIYIYIILIYFTVFSGSLLVFLTYIIPIAGHCY